MISGRFTVPVRIILKWIIRNMSDRVRCTAFWIVIPCSIVSGHKVFGRIYTLQLHKW
jgi:hypothetical protein